MTTCGVPKGIRTRVSALNEAVSGRFGARSSGASVKPRHACGPNPTPGGNISGRGIVRPHPSMAIVADVPAVATHGGVGARQFAAAMVNARPPDESVTIEDYCSTFPSPKEKPS